MKKILFMGTPEISMISLKRLIDDGHNIVAVITGEDKPRGRGNVILAGHARVNVIDALHGRATGLPFLQYHSRAHPSKSVLESLMPASGASVARSSIMRSSSHRR